MLLADALERALRHGTFENLPDPTDERDALRALLRIHALHLAPLDSPATMRCSAFAAHPAVATLKSMLEQRWLAELGAAHPLRAVDSTGSAPQAMRALGAHGRLPRIYRWLAESASFDELVRFLSYEGGPDADFDDLVSSCQIGLVGAPKAELARNYWDEMGEGDPAAVHTTLHSRMARSLGIVPIPESERPVAMLARQAFGGLLATNHHLQPEMLGALGLIELQAGPRCRMVLRALERVAAPADVYPFYAVHAEVDPQHGADWLDNAVAPTVARYPEWAPRILRGAQWRRAIDDAFFSWAADAFAPAADGEAQDASFCSAA